MALGPKCWDVQKQWTIKQAILHNIIEWWNTSEQSFLESGSKRSCCSLLTLSLQENDFDFLFMYEGFLGIWQQVQLVTFFNSWAFFVWQQDGEVNDRPVYRKLGNENLFLAYSRVMEEDYYPVPWTMWGGPTMRPGDHIGNIKIGPKNLSCPENYSVWGLLLYSTVLRFVEHRSWNSESCCCCYCEMTSFR